MLLVSYLEERADPKEVEQRLKTVFPQAVLKTAGEARKISLEVPPIEAPAAIKGKVLAVEGISRTDWMR